MARPRVSVGLPVYNGANYVAAAIESVLAQTWSDFELVISDNASSDDTEEICRAYAARDSRIRYDRLSQNIGAALNFNRVFAMARGEYFRWLAHDDLLRPECLARSVAALDADIGAVLCQTLVQRIGPEGEDLGLYDSGVRAWSRRPSKRLAPAVRLWHDCTDMFGLIRSRALTGTPLIAPYVGSERALIAILALKGRFVRIDEPLFCNRDHPRRFIRAHWKKPAEETAFYDPKASRPALHTLHVFRLLLAGIEEFVDSPIERLRCRALVARAAVSRQNRHALIKESLMAAYPRLGDWVVAARRKPAGA